MINNIREKAVFLDIDGTLTEPGGNVPPASALRAIKGARKNGHKIFLCTGRNYQMLQPLLKYGFDGVVASSGGYILCEDKVVFDCPMSEEQRQKAFKVLKENGIYRTVECLDGSYTDEGFKEFLAAHSDKGGNSELLRWRRQIESALGILPMKEYRGQAVYKIVIMFQEESQLDGPEKVLSDEFNFCIQDKDSYGIINGEIVNRQFDKGKAVEFVCDYLGIPLENSIAFGDSVNDREMFEKCGTGICMANGSESAKKMADAICPSVIDDGILRAFEKYGLLHQ